MVNCDICEKEIMINQVYMVKLEKPRDIKPKGVMSPLFNNFFMNFNVCKTCLNKFYRMALLKDEVKKDGNK